uniref:Src kinase-associated phosphoprotein 1 n=1 Tax=Acanthochromis polyacanthus TaxID=80966 RepID=A0A3Q1G4P9_9TELE
MGTIPTDIRRLLDDCELFVLDILQDENLSESAEETRQVLLNNFRVVHARNLLSEFRDEDGSDDNHSSSLGRSAPSDDASDYQDDGVPEYFGDIPPVAAQDLSNILKQGYLEKKRKDHSFFGSEWQKRWCVLNNSIFYYFGSDKDKQQKGSFYINEYDVQLVTNLRKDSKKNACFEFTAPGRRAFQFTASSPQEAREWVNQIKFVLTGKPASLFAYCVFFSRKTIPALYLLPFSLKVVTLKRNQVRISSQAIMRLFHLCGSILVCLNLCFLSASSTDYANYYQGLWDCQADEPDELDFQRGDLIYIISKEYNIHGWWVGELNGTVGIVPKDFLHPAYIL